MTGIPELWARRIPDGADMGWAAAFFVLAVALGWLAAGRPGRVRSAGVAGAAREAEARASGSRKIIIFYSSIGYGHISAAQAIAEEIRRRAPETQVLLQDIRAFMHPVWRRLDERLYWFVAGNLPESFEHLFFVMQDRGGRVSSLSKLPSNYPEEKLSAYLEQQQPDVILSTHYGAAQVLGTLRQKGLLSETSIGWLHTDFFEGYFPRVSKCIDRSFLAHPELEARWLAAGVPADKVVTSGMPLRIDVPSVETRRNTLDALGLASNVPTVLLAGGKQGAGDYSDVVDGLVRHWAGTLQVIAVCGTSDRQRAALTTRQDEWPSRLTLRIFGLVPRADMVSYMGAADILMTKAGGLTAAEAFTVGVPTILLDVISGHERENAALFVRQGLARLAASPNDAGRIAAEILSEPIHGQELLRAQSAFRERSNVASIVGFALDETFVPARPLPDYGVESGASALGVAEALRCLDAEAPAEVELLLSYSNAATPQRFILDNPFGHIAIRIGDVVYSANHIADPSVDPHFLQTLSLADYLYGVEPPSRSQLHTSTYGMAYGRETLGLRVGGIAAERRAAMVAEATRIERAFVTGALRWDRDRFNCADAVARILAAAGYDQRSLYRRAGLPSMPLDLFEQMRARFEKEASLREDLVAYRLLPGAQASHRFCRFPLSVGQPLRSLAKVLASAPEDALERETTRQVTSYFGDRRLYVEDLHLGASSLEAGNFPAPGHPRPTLEQAILTDLGRMIAIYAGLPLKRIERMGSLRATEQFHRLVDRGLELARLATEEAESSRRSPRAGARLRALFDELVQDYARIDPRRFELRPTQAYLLRLRTFQATLAREISSPGIGSWGRVWMPLRILYRQQGAALRRLLRRSAG